MPKSSDVELAANCAEVEVSLDKVTPVEALPLRQVSLRPNPASAVLYVENAAEVAQLTVVSLQDVAIARYENAAGEATVRLPLTGLAEGVYCLVVEDGEGRRVVPFVVRN